MKTPARILWAYKVNTVEESEIVQRMAFSFGYIWVEPGTEFQKPIHLTEPYLVFSDRHTLTYSSTSKFLTELGIPVATTLTQAMEYFKNPPIEKKEEEKETKKEEKLPLVRFSYAKKTGEQSYLIEVINYNQEKEYLEGLDVEADRQFKRFNFERIIGQIVFLGFSEKE